MEQDGDAIPSPTPISKIHTAENEVAVLVSVYMPAIRDKAQTASVKKTLTLPTWLNDLAENEGINFLKRCNLSSKACCSIIVNKNRPLVLAHQRAATDRTVGDAITRI